MNQSGKRPIREKLEALLIDFIGVIGFNLILFVAKKLSHYLFGDEMLFEKLRMEYLFDAGHAALIICFSIRACINLFKD
jgi:hypothetical protein